MLCLCVLCANLCVLCGYKDFFNSPQGAYSTQGGIHHKDHYIIKFNIFTDKLKKLTFYGGDCNYKC